MTVTTVHRKMTTKRHRFNSISKERLNPSPRSEASSLRFHCSQHNHSMSCIRLQITQSFATGFNNDSASWYQQQLRCMTVTTVQPKMAAKRHRFNSTWRLSLNHSDCYPSKNSEASSLRFQGSQRAVSDCKPHSHSRVSSIATQ